MKKISKVWVLIGVLLSLGLILTACGDNTATSAPASAITPTGKPVIITGNGSFEGELKVLQQVISASQNYVSLRYMAEQRNENNQALVTINYTAVRSKATGEEWKMDWTQWKQSYTTIDFTNQLIITGGKRYSNYNEQGWIREENTGSGEYDRWCQSFAEFLKLDRNQLDGWSFTLLPDENFNGKTAGQFLLEKPGSNQAEIAVLYDKQTYKPLRVISGWYYIAYEYDNPVWKIEKPASWTEATPAPTVILPAQTTAIPAPTGVKDGKNNGPELYNLVLKASSSYKSVRITLRDTLSLKGKDDPTKLSQQERYSEATIIKTAKTAISLTEKVGATAYFIIIDGVEYRKIPGQNDWETVTNAYEVNSSLENWLIRFDLASQIKVNKPEELKISLLPDEQFEGRLVGVLAVNGTGTYTLRFDKTTFQAVQLVEKDSSGVTVMEWQAYDYDNPNLKIEPPVKVGNNQLATEQFVRQLISSAFNYSAARFRLTGKMQNSSTGALEDFSCNSTVIKEAGNPSNYSAFSVELQELKGVTRYLYVNGKYYQQENSKSWELTSSERALWALYYTVPIVPFEGNIVNIRQLPDLTVNGQMLGQLSFETENSGGVSDQQIEFQYEKGSLRLVHSTWKMQNGNSGDWTIYDYNSPDVKVEAPAGL